MIDCVCEVHSSPSQICGENDYMYTFARGKPFVEIKITPENVNDIQIDRMSLLIHVSIYGVTCRANAHRGMACGATETMWIKKLLDMGVDINVRDCYNLSALEHVIIRGSTESIILLIDRGASDSYKSDYNYLMKTNMHGMHMYRNSFAYSHYFTQQCNESRMRCRQIAIAICGLKILGIVIDVNILKMMGKHVWSTRLYQDEWMSDTKTKK